MMPPPEGLVAILEMKDDNARLKRELAERKEHVTRLQARCGQLLKRAQAAEAQVVPDAERCTHESASVLTAVFGDEWTRCKNGRAPRAFVCTGHMSEWQRAQRLTPADKLLQAVLAGEAS